MNKNEIEETQAFWNRVAEDWDTQVGDEGDSNRIFNSDPVLWKFAGDVRGLSVLDAGCGTGYLSRKLHKQGAQVIGVDFSEKMIEIARAKTPGIDYRVDSCSDLRGIEDGSLDLVIANYVLMDTPDLEGTMRAFHRVLGVGGLVVAILSHPCFPQGSAKGSQKDGGIRYTWTFSYFERQKRIDPAWGHFTSEFIWFHRPLSDYWKTFRGAGFEVVDFEEPRVSSERAHLIDNRGKFLSRSRPYSVAFKMRRRTIA